MTELQRALRNAARSNGEVNVSRRSNVVVSSNHGGEGEHQVASAEQIAPIVQNGRRRG